MDWHFSCTAHPKFSPRAVTLPIEGNNVTYRFAAQELSSPFAPANPGDRPAYRLRFGLLGGSATSFGNINWPRRRGLALAFGPDRFSVCREGSANSSGILLTLASTKFAEADRVRTGSSRMPGIAELRP